MMKSLIAILAVLSVGAVLQGQSTGQRVNSFDSLRFLQGTWDAKTASGPGGSPAVAGSYSFRTELNGHILARHSSSDSCKGPANFDCDHNDLLYVYQELAGQPLKAIYLDNEGHVIHYDVFLMTPTSMAFISSDAAPGPKFRLLYDLHEGVMAGKFQMQMPGQSDWKSYLEWSGAKK